MTKKQNKHIITKAIKGKEVIYLSARDEEKGLDIFKLMALDRSEKGLKHNHYSSHDTEIFTMDKQEALEFFDGLNNMMFQRLPYGFGYVEYYRILLDLGNGEVRFVSTKDKDYFEWLKKQKNVLRVRG